MSSETLCAEQCLHVHLKFSTSPIVQAVSAYWDALVLLQLEEFKKRKAAAAAKKAGTPSLTPQSTPLVTPVKGPEITANKQTPSAAPKAVNTTARRLPAGQPVHPPTAGNKQNAETTARHAELAVPQPAAASNAREDGEHHLSLPAPVGVIPPVPSKVEATAAQDPGQQTAQVPAPLQAYENGNDAAHSRRPVVPSAAEQQRIHQLEQQLLEMQSQSKNQLESLQQALDDRQEVLQGLQSQHAAAERAAAGLKQELSQQEAEKAELRQHLQHLEAEQQMRLDAQIREATTLNRSLQGQVNTGFWFHVDL